MAVSATAKTTHPVVVCTRNSNTTTSGSLLSLRHFAAFLNIIQACIIRWHYAKSFVSVNIMYSNIFLANIYLRHVNELRAFLRRRVGCHEIAAELTQETFIRIMSYSGETVQNTRAMLYRIASNLAIDHHRTNVKEPDTVCINDLSYDDQPATDLTNPARVVCARQFLEKLCVVIEGLPPQCHRAFILHKFDGYSHVEIAEKLGITRNAVEKLLIRALVQLRQILV